MLKASANCPKRSVSEVTLKNKRLTGDVISVLSTSDPVGVDKGVKVDSVLALYPKPKASPREMVTIAGGVCQGDARQTKPHNTQNRV